MRSLVKPMPTREEFDSAAARLKAAGFAHGSSLLINNAHDEGVIEFGMWHRHPDGRTFWLNYKTLSSLPDGI